MNTPDRHQSAALREIYLAEVTVHLTPRLSPIETYESVEELREHINAMAAAYEEVGAEPAVAMVTSLDRFGPARELGGSIASAASRKDTAPHWQTVEITVPMSLMMTMSMVTAAAFCLLQGVQLWFTLVFRDRSMPFLLATEISFAVGLVVSPIGWVLHRWSAVCVGAVMAAVLNVFLGLTFYPAYASLGLPGELVHIAIALTISVFLLGIAATWFARRFRAQFPASRSRWHRRLGTN